MSEEIILASTSPRRADLLRLLGVPFRAMTVGVDETGLPGESPWLSARRLAVLKLSAARRIDGCDLLLTADTVVDLDGTALGKPESAEDAFRMLSELRGRWHEVHTAVAAAREGTVAVSVCTTRVLMRRYSDPEVWSYVASGSPFDKAGAYAIQDPCFRPVERWSGSYTNVVGLPERAVARKLEEFGLSVQLPPDGPGTTAISCRALGE